MKHIAQLSIDIKGRPWHFKLFSDRNFDKMHNDEEMSTGAITIPSKYEVHFSKSTWDLNFIRHEIFHIFYAMSEVASSDLTPDQVEETMCSIGGAYLQDIALISDRVAECFFNHNKV